MMKKLNYLTVLLMIWAMQACNNPQKKDSVSLANEANDSLGDQDTNAVVLDEFDTLNEMYNDSDFAVEAADGGLLEVQLGEIAATNASDPGVKDFGKLMVKDHSRINKELTALAKKKGIILPPTPSKKNIDLIKNLNDKMGNDFDKDYIDHMVSDHEKDIDLFENALKKTMDDDIKAFVNKELPFLKTHLAAAKVLKDKL